MIILYGNTLFFWLMIQIHRWGNCTVLLLLVTLDKMQEHKKVDCKIITDWTGLQNTTTIQRLTITILHWHYNTNSTMKMSHPPFWIISQKQKYCIVWCLMERKTCINKSTTKTHPYALNHLKEDCISQAQFQIPIFLQNIFPRSLQSTWGICTTYGSWWLCWLVDENCSSFYHDVSTKSAQYTMYCTVI